MKFWERPLFNISEYAFKYCDYTFCFVNNGWAMVFIDDQIHSHIENFKSCLLLYIKMLGKMHKIALNIDH